MARFVNKGTDEKPKYEIDTEASTSLNPHGTAKKAIAAKKAEAQKTKNSKAEGAK